MRITYAVLFYRQQHWVPNAVRAAYIQTYPDIEFIFSDDGSGDGTAQAIRDAVATYSEDLQQRTKVVAHPKNLGIVQHINALVAQATGDVIALIAGDDLSLSTWIERSAQAFADPRVTLVWSNHLKIDHGGKVIDSSCIPVLPAATLTDVMQSEGLGLPGAGAIFRRSVFDAFGPLPCDVQNEDDQTLVRSAILGETVVLTDTLFIYRIHAKSASYWLRNSRGRPQAIVEQECLEEKNRIAHCKHWLQLIKAHPGPKPRSNAAELATIIQQKIDAHRQRLTELEAASKYQMILTAQRIRARRAWRALRFALGRIARRRRTQHSFSAIKQSHRYDLTQLEIFG